jgi:hypothetical protein
LNLLSFGMLGQHLTRFLSLQWWSKFGSIFGGAWFAKMLLLWAGAWCSWLVLQHVPFVIWKTAVDRLPSGQTLQPPIWHFLNHWTTGWHWHIDQHYRLPCKSGSLTPKVCITKSLPVFWVCLIVLLGKAIDL